MKGNMNYTVHAGWEEDRPVGTLSIEKNRGKEMISFSFPMTGSLIMVTSCLIRSYSPGLAGSLRKMGFGDAFLMPLRTVGDVC